MPCTYYTPEEERQMAQKSARETREKLNAVTHELDQTRELLLRFLSGETPEVPAKLRKEMERRQIEHRKVDLKRLEETFITDKDAERLEKVWAADPNYPLEPQLGFDPDAF